MSGPGAGHLFMLLLFDVCHCDHDWFVFLYQCIYRVTEAVAFTSKSVSVMVVVGIVSRAVLTFASISCDGIVPGESHLWISSVDATVMTRGGVSSGSA